MLQRLPGRLPGLYCIQTDAQGERCFLYWRNEAAVRECFTNTSAAQVLTALDDYSVFYLSGFTLAVLGEAGLGASANSGTRTWRQTGIRQ